MTFNRMLQAADQQSKKKQLELRAILSPSTVNVKADQAINLIATLRNEGDRSLRVFREPTVNQGALLYNSWICELKREGIEYLGWKNWRHSVYPIFPRHRDTKKIRSGREVQTEFDLQDWYPLDSSGTYQ
ncbi:MAG: hypothetical protein RLZZ519_2492, partial [Bacteroidota bacterium]